MEYAQLLQLLKQYGPVVGLLLLHVWWLTRRIDALLDRNSKIYEGHIEHLWKTQERLMTSILGSQPSSEAAPTIEQLKQKAIESKDDKGGQAK